MEPIVAANNQFAFDLYAKLADGGGNTFFSPYSLSTALAMTRTGARGETAAQMARTLHLALSDDALDAAVKALIERINGEGTKRSYELAVANALWGQSGLGYADNFLKRLDRSYGAALRELDFMADPERAREAINTWVDEQTKNKIRDLLARGTIDRQTELVLTNAIYFKGRWRSAFDKALTHDEDFFVPKNEPVRVPSMHLDARFPYAEGPGFQALELPYMGDGLAMLVLLPRERDGLAAVQRALASATALKLTPREVDVTLPRFKMTSGFELKPVLAQLGMPLAFTGQADFSGMNGRGGIAISAVIHKAFVDVNEEGTEAAAATGVLMKRALAAKTPRPVVFRADHPFVVLIREASTGCILFLGRVVDPRS